MCRSNLHLNTEVWHLRCNFCEVVVKMEHLLAQLALLWRLNERWWNHMQEEHLIRQHLELIGFSDADKSKLSSCSAENKASWHGSKGESIQKLHWFAYSNAFYSPRRKMECVCVCPYMWIYIPDHLHRTASYTDWHTYSTFQLSLHQLSPIYLLPSMSKLVPPVLTLGWQKYFVYCQQARVLVHFHAV